jgi:glycosyltransferase involved in cell wall biosynthesis
MVKEVITRIFNNDMKYIKEDMSLISIIVPAYNVEKFLPTCIDSIITQTFTDFELILVNDGSTDSSAEICDFYAQKDIRIKVIHQKNQGLVNARKSGLSIASSKYVLYIDGDDYVESDFCEKLINQTINFDADIVIGGYIRNYRGRMISIKSVIPAGRYENEEIDSIWKKMIYTGDFFLHGISTYSWGKLFKRDILLPIQMSIPSDITIGEDAACVYPFISKVKKLVIVDECNYHYVQHQSSMLKTFSNVKYEIEKLSNLFSYLLNFFKEHKNYENFYLQLKPYFLSQLMIRTGGLLKNKIGNNLLIGNLVKLNEKIAIYNSGTFGQQIYRRLIEEKFENVIWVDEDADLCNKDQLPVHDPIILKSLNFDKIFIASLNPIYITRIQNELLNLGYSNEKIFKFKKTSDFDDLIIKYNVDPNSFNIVTSQ